MQRSPPWGCLLRPLVAFVPHQSCRFWCLKYTLKYTGSSLSILFQWGGEWLTEIIQHKGIQEIAFKDSFYYFSVLKTRNLFQQRPTNYATHSKNIYYFDYFLFSSVLSTNLILKLFFKSQGAIWR
jgi:hypothetical protein